MFIILTLSLPFVNCLDCWVYEAYSKSDAGKATFADKKCSGSQGKPEACVYTCPSEEAMCYNWYEDTGYGPDGTKGGESGNYAKQKGGCIEGKECKAPGGENPASFECCASDKCNGEEAASEAAKVQLS